MANTNQQENRMMRPPTGTPGTGAPGTHRPERPPVSGITPPIGTLPGNNNNNNRPNRPPAGNPSFDKAPNSAPPSIVPLRSPGVARIDPGSIRNCLGNFTYIWLNNGAEFWIFPVMVGSRSLSGFRWDRRFGWVFFGVNLNRIDAFTCAPY